MKLRQLVSLPHSKPQKLSVPTYKIPQVNTYIHTFFGRDAAVTPV